MIQCAFQGITNSTDFSVLRMMPLSDGILSRATTRCTPLDARTRNRPRPPDSRCSSSVHTPVELITTRPRTVVSSPVSTSRTVTPATRSASLTKPITWVEVRTTAPYSAAVLATAKGVPGVVDLPVVVPQPADERVAAQRRHQPQRAGPGQVLVPRHRASAAHRVVHDQAATDVGPLDDVLGQRVEERDRLGQVRADLGEHQLAFVQRLADQPELEHLQVPQPTMEQLRGPGRGAGGNVTCFDQGNRETAGDRIQGGTGADHAAADDDHVERLGAQAEPGRRALLRAEL